MTLPRASGVAGALIAAALFAGSGVWRAEAQQGPAREVKAVVAGELIWWLETTAKGPRVSVCTFFDGRNVRCESASLER